MISTMCRELRKEIQKKYREVAEKPRGNLRTSSKSGADERIRTADPLFTKQLLCQLSYVGVRPDYMRGLAAPTLPSPEGEDSYRDSPAGEGIVMKWRPSCAPAPGD